MPQVLNANRALEGGNVKTATAQYNVFIFPPKNVCNNKRVNFLFLPPQPHSSDSTN